LVGRKPSALDPPAIPPLSLAGLPLSKAVGHHKVEHAVLNRLLQVGRTSSSSPGSSAVWRASVAGARSGDASAEIRSANMGKSVSQRW
jgi:hypothetical protein